MSPEPPARQDPNPTRAPSPAATVSGADAADLAAARHAWHAAPTTCVPGCAAYHRLWPTLRLLGLGSGPARHGALFAGAVRQAATSPTTRPTILVVGQADHAMAALVLDALAGTPARLGLLDRCPTPVEAARRWVRAQRPDLDVVEEVVDARLAPSPTSAAIDADLAVTHSFLSQVPAADRVALLTAVGARLAPGGRLVTNTRLADPDDHGRFDDDAASRLRSAVAAAGAARPELLPAPIGAVLDAVEPYITAVAIHPVHTIEELRASTTEAGLEVEALRAVSLDGGTRGPGTAQAATYLELVARRPPLS